MPLPLFLPLHLQLLPAVPLLSTTADMGFQAHFCTDGVLATRCATEVQLPQRGTYYMHALLSGQKEMFGNAWLQLDLGEPDTEVSAVVIYYDCASLLFTSMHAHNLRTFADGVEGSLMLPCDTSDEWQGTQPLNVGVSNSVCLSRYYGCAFRDGVTGEPNPVFSEEAGKARNVTWTKNADKKCGSDSVTLDNYRLCDQNHPDKAVHDTYNILFDSAVGGGFAALLCDVANKQMADINWGFRICAALPLSLCAAVEMEKRSEDGLYGFTFWGGGMTDTRTHTDTNTFDCYTKNVAQTSGDPIPVAKGTECMSRILDGDDPGLQAADSGPATQQRLLVTCPSSTRGRFVYLEMPNMGRDMHVRQLRLREVEVYGPPRCPVCAACSEVPPVSVDHQHAAFIAVWELRPMTRFDKVHNFTATGRRRGDEFDEESILFHQDLSPTGRPLAGPIFGMRVELDWHDQMWGMHRKGAIAIRVRRAVGKYTYVRPTCALIASQVVGHAPKRRTRETFEFDENDEIVKHAQAGDVIVVNTKVGGGGGHELVFFKLRISVRYRLPPTRRILDVVGPNGELFDADEIDENYNPIPNWNATHFPNGTPTPPRVGSNTRRALRSSAYTYDEDESEDARKRRLRTVPKGVKMWKTKSKKRAREEKAKRIAEIKKERKKGRRRARLLEAKQRARLLDPALEERRTEGEEVPDEKLDVEGDMSAPPDEIFGDSEDLEDDDEDLNPDDEMTDEKLLEDEKEKLRIRKMQAAAKANDTDKAAEGATSPPSTSDKPRPDYIFDSVSRSFKTPDGRPVKVDPQTGKILAFLDAQSTDAEKTTPEPVEVEEVAEDTVLDYKPEL
ncbi:unnamed protein product [Amoebophrya sp. A25]|nr:unnamed protein product [Amoebophrya sp. A25]|eukprot:GSA25T00020685001.1